MDFTFGKKAIKGISIFIKNKIIYIYIPNYLQKKLNQNNIANWIREINGNLDLISNEITVPITTKPSEIYNSYYHFVE